MIFFLFMFLYFFTFIFSYRYTCICNFFFETNCSAKHVTEVKLLFKTGAYLPTKKLNMVIGIGHATKLFFCFNIFFVIYFIHIFNSFVPKNVCYCFYLILLFFTCIYLFAQCTATIHKMLSKVDILKLFITFRLQSIILMVGNNRSTFRHYFHYILYKKNFFFV